MLGLIHDYGRLWWWSFLLLLPVVGLDWARGRLAALCAVVHVHREGARFDKREGVRIRRSVGSDCRINIFATLPTGRVGSSHCLLLSRVMMR